VTIDLPVLANVLDRQFTVDGPSQRWVGDTTECVIGESGKLYLARDPPPGSSWNG